MGAEEEEDEAEHDDERYEVQGAFLPRRPRHRRLLGLGLHVGVVTAAGFLRQELGHRRDAHLPLHPGTKKCGAKRIGLWPVQQPRKAAVLNKPPATLTKSQGKVYAR